MKWLISRQLYRPSLYPFCSSMGIKNLSCFSSLRIFFRQHLRFYFQSVLSIGVCGVFFGWRWKGLCLVLCWGIWAYTDTGVKSGLSCFKLAPVWPEQMWGLFSHDGSIADGGPEGPVSWLHRESLLETDTLTKRNNAGQSNYTTALDVKTTLFTFLKHVPTLIKKEKGLSS